MAKKKNRGGGGKSLVRSVEKIIKAGALIAPGAYRIYASPDSHGVAGAAKAYTGYNMETGEWHLRDMGEGWLPVIAVEGGSILVHKAIGLIRRL